MKKIAIILALTLALATLAGCSSSESTGETASTTTTETAAELLEVYLLISARGDLSFWDSMALGAEQAQADFGDSANITIIETTSDVQSNLTAMYEAADKGADMIITGPEFLDNVATVAGEYDDIDFIMIDENMEGVDGVYSLNFKVAEAAFLAGIAAADVAMQNGNDAVGFIGGMEFYIIQDPLLGFIQGAQYYNDQIEVVYNYVGAFDDPDTGRTQALAQYNDANVGVIYACAGGSGNGVHQAASEVGRYVIGADSDQSATYSEQPDIQKTFVTSCMKLTGNAIYDAIEMLVNGEEIPTGTRALTGVKEEYVGIVENELFDEYVSEEGKAAIAAAADAIANGEIEVIGALDRDPADVLADIDSLLA